MKRQRRGLACSIHWGQKATSAGLLSTDNTANGELFYGGTGAMMYSGSGDIAKADELLRQWPAGIFPGAGRGRHGEHGDQRTLHAGFAYAFVVDL